MIKLGRQIACTALIFGLAVASSCTDRELNSKMTELKQTIILSDTYVDAFQRRVESVKESLDSARSDSLRATLAYSLFKEYEHFNTDSAKVYADLVIELPYIGIPKAMLKAWQYAIDGDNGKFGKIFDEFDMDAVPGRYRNDCYNFLVCSYQFINSTDRKLCNFMSQAALDPAIETDLKEMFLGTVFRTEDEHLLAREHYISSYKASSSTHMKAKSAYLIAHTFRVAGNMDKYEYWLAQSAIHDFNVPVKSYSALQYLAMVELERGRLKNASDMVDVFVKDALESKYWVRVTTAIEFEQAIISKIGRIGKGSIIGLMASVVLLLVITLMLISLLKKNVRQRKMLAEANASIEEMNRALTQSDKEKEEYIHKYMKLSLNYLGSVEQYRHKLRMLMKTEGKDAVIAQLRGPSETESEYSDFYREFDRTFLKIYPDFVSKVNSLLKPEARFQDEHTMNLPLRVLAAIRLGIKESREIAAFLNCAPSSVYTYRSKMKANAISGKDDFESRICEIS